MSRFWPAGIPIHVTSDALATPTSFVWNRSRHQIVHVVERWRVDERWWHERIWREYFTLLTNSGMLVQVYHDLLSQEWRLQRLYD